MKTKIDCQKPQKKSKCKFGKSFDQNANEKKRAEI